MQVGLNIAARRCEAISAFQRFQCFLIIALRCQRHCQATDPNGRLDIVADAGASTFPVALLSSLKSTIKPFWGVGAMVLFMTTMSALAYVGYVLKKSGESSSQIAATLGGG